MQKRNKIITLLLLAFLAIGLAQCSIYKTMVNISRLQFKLQSVQNFKVLNFSLNNKNSLKDFSPFDLIKLTSSLTKGELPVSFTLNVVAKNPNTGNGFGSTDITIKNFPWQLYLNDKKVVEGELNNPITVPGMGEQKTFPLNVKFDILKIFKNKSLDEIINLALTIGGAKGSPSKLKLIAKPVLDTPIGEMSYPKPITIISKEFRGR